ncbi:MAG: redox-regulated ATPase YchF [bacterium]|nr:redox-regulated ATPase YchF [bacterium]
MLIGVVGKANVGKSTFFKAATLAEVEIANYPFATIKPNHGVGFVKIECAEKHFNVTCNPRVGYCINGKRFVPVDMLDVAGLVPGAHEGKGMGNQFLDDLNQADALIHVVDISGSTNEKGESVGPGKHDPVIDVRFLEIELDMWYLNMLKKAWDKFVRQQSQENSDIEKALHKQFAGIGANENMIMDTLIELELNEKKPITWSEEEIKSFAVSLRKKTKPMIIAANKIDLPGASENYERVKKEFPDSVILPCSAESELALKEAAKHELIKYLPGTNDFEIADDSKLSDKQKQALEFIKKEVLVKHKSTGVQEIINSAVFDVLKYIAIFPGGVNKLEDKDGNVLPDCFLLPENSTALDFAFRIHTDIGNAFIKAIDVKTKRTVGKEHPLKTGDVIEICV